MRFEHGESDRDGAAPPMRWSPLWIVSVFVGLLFTPTAATADGDQETIDYASRIKPILEGRCYSCHGALKQKARLRVDTVQSLLEGGDSGPTIEPGKSDESLLIDLVSETGDMRMPPPGEGEPLSSEHIELFKAWIDQGAAAPDDDAPEPDPRDHWAFLAPLAADAPAEAQPSDNPIDAFLDAARRERGLVAQGFAPKGLLQRRVYLDLTGLPPTPDEQAEFLRDESPDAYEAMVDRLLASKAYAERWGRHWMDVWRYSDWWGLGAEVRNSQKHIWRWRDWILESLDGDKGYDQMVREMLAADELHPDDPDKLRATGFLARSYFKFNRNTWLDEVVEHTGKAFMGMTLNCAKCHDHKFDPISQDEYFQFRAIFEPYQIRTDQIPGQLDFTVDGLPRVFDCNLDAPTYRFTRGDEAQPETHRSLPPGVPRSLTWSEFDVKPVTLPVESARPGLRPFVVEDQLRVAADRVASARAELEELDELLALLESDQSERAEIGVLPSFQDDFSAARPDVWETKGEGWAYEGGRLLQKEPGEVRSEQWPRVVLPVDFQATLRFTIAGGDPWRSVGLSFDASEEREVFVYLSAHAGGPKLQLTYRRGRSNVYPRGGLRSLPIKAGEPYELTVRVRDTLVNVDLNGEPALAYRLPIERTPGAIGFATYAATAEFERLEISELPTDVALVEADGSTYKGATALERARSRRQVAEKAMATALAHPRALQARAEADRALHQRPPAENAKGLVAEAAEAEKLETLARAEEALALLENQENPKASSEEVSKQLQEAAAAVAAAREALANPSEEYTPLRGAMKTVESPTDDQAPNVLTYPDVSTGRRSALANWLTDRRNPLTARVAVNHIWTRHFGSPLVATVFDFGRKGNQATHPELLDRLAVDFMEDGWSMKRLHRRIVTSQSYRRLSSNAGADPTTLAADPENRYYWRMNSVRMESQVVRDSLLKLAGDLSDEFGGPPVSHTETTSPRRSIYFFHSHNDHNQFLSTFDDAAVLDCYRRDESIVPVQSLALWNSGFAQATSAKIADHLNGRLETAGDADFIAEAFLMILGSAPSIEETSACTAALDELKTIASERKAPDPGRRAREILVQTLLNHNDFITIR